MAQELPRKVVHHEEPRLTAWQKRHKDTQSVENNLCTLVGYVYRKNSNYFLTSGLKKLRSTVAARMHNRRSATDANTIK